MKSHFVSLNVDFIGFSASLLCAVHCAALPFLLTLAPLAGLQLLDSPWVEYAFIVLSICIATGALVQGYRKHHHKFLPLIIAVAGFVLIGLGQFLELSWAEALLTATGGATIAIAHLMNWKHIVQSKPQACHKAAPDETALT